MNLWKHEFIITIRIEKPRYLWHSYYAHKYTVHTSKVDTKYLEWFWIQSLEGFAKLLKKTPLIVRMHYTNIVFGVIWCFMSFVTILMTILTNKWTNTTLDDRNLMKSLPIIQTKFSVFCIVSFFQWNVVMECWFLDEKWLSTKWWELQYY